MKKKAVLLITVIILSLILFDVQIYARMPSTLSFETVDEMRELVLAVRGTSDEFAEYLEKDNGKVIRGIIPFKDLKLMVEDRVMYAPFISLREGEVYESFRSNVRYDDLIDHWEIVYKVEEVTYCFQYAFDKELLSNPIDNISEDRNLGNCDIVLTQGDNGYVGTYVLSEGVTLIIKAICEDSNSVDLGLFNLGALSLELDADRTTAATTDVTENITTTLQTSAVDEKTQDNEKNALDNVLIVVGVVLLTAALSSLVTAVIINKRRRSKD